MKYTSKRTILAILAGALIGIALILFVRLVCWGQILGVAVAAYLANVSSPREGAVVGAIVLVPVAMVGVFPTIAHQTELDELSIPLFLLSIFFASLFAGAVGAVYGLVLGKLFEKRKKGESIIL